MFPRQFHTFTSKFVSFLCSKSIHLFTLFHFMSHKYFKFNMSQTNSSPLPSYHFQGSSTLLINIMIIHIFAPDRHLGVIIWLFSLLKLPNSQPITSTHWLQGLNLSHNCSLLSILTTIKTVIIISHLDYQKSSQVIWLHSIFLH